VGRFFAEALHTHRAGQPVQSPSLGEIFAVSAATGAVLALWRRWGLRDPLPWRCRQLLGSAETPGRRPRGTKCRTYAPPAGAGAWSYAGFTGPAQSDPQAAVLGKEGYGVCGVGLLIRINNEEFVEELCGHYRRSGFSAERVGGAMIEVTAPTARAADERTQILAHLRVWNLVNPDASAEAVN
jgi:hypothetical protein